MAISAVPICHFTAHAADETVRDNTSVENTSLKALLSSRDVPLGIKMGELDASWRRFVISGSGIADLQWQMLGARSGIEFGVHFTQGKTASVNGETYLVAYRLPVNIDPRFLNWHGHGDPPKPRKPTSETELTLSLLNLRTTGSLNDLRAFQRDVDMIDTRQANADSVKTLESLGQGVIRYIRARGVMPYLTNPLRWDANRVFYPYVGDERLYMHPATQEMYRWNTILNNKKIVHIKDRQSMAVFYEASDSGDGTRGVLFLDGHVERLSPERWTKIKKASKIQIDNADDEESEDE